MRFKAPYLRYEQVNAAAIDLLKRYGRVGHRPVDIEALAECDLQMRIDLRPGLMAGLGVDGYLSLDMNTIVVDEGVYNRQLPRYRFTLAHELGHRELHGKLLTGLGISTEEEWIEFYLTLDESSYGWFERQAYWFAGAILVPQDLLVVSYDGVLKRLIAKGFDGSQLSGYSRSTVAGRIAREFEVSTDVIERRLSELHLW